jgi:3-oxoacyl-[acyl-carrier-protein] synthase-3
MGIKLIAAGKELPGKIVTNAELAPILGVTPEWIRERSGIVERRWEDKGRVTSDLAAAAARDCLKRASLEPDDVDCYIFATLSPDHLFPGIGNYAQRKIGIKGNIPCIDIRQQCTGFIFASQIAAAFLSSGMHRRVMVIGAEIQSKGLDLSPRGKEVSMLFGDGAGAALFERTPEPADFYVRTYSAGEFAPILHFDVIETQRTPHVYPMSDAEHVYPQMEGRKVFVHAVEGCAQMLGEWLKNNGRSDFAPIDHFFFHQANIRINMMTMQKLGIPESKAPSNIDKYGNCSAASIPILICEALESGRMKSGDTFAMLGFGSGFNYGLMVMKAA